MLKLNNLIAHFSSNQDEQAKRWFKEKITPFLNPLNLFKSDNPKESAMIRIIMLKFPELSEVQEYEKILDLINNPKKNLRSIINPISAELFKQIQSAYQDGLLAEIPEHLRTPQICEIAVKLDNFALAHVPKDLKTAKLCELAVEQSGWALEYVPEDLKTFELCQLAVNKERSAINHVPKEFKKEINRQLLWR